MRRTDVLIRHSAEHLGIGKYLAVIPNESEGKVDGVGPESEINDASRWEAITREYGTKISFRSKKTGNFLRMQKDGKQYKINLGGTCKFQDELSMFKVHHEGASGIKLESIKYTGWFVGIRKNKDLYYIGGIKGANHGEMCTFNIVLLDPIPADQAPKDTSIII